MAQTKSKAPRRRVSGTPVALQTIRMLADWTVDGRARKIGDEFACPVVFAEIAITRGKAVAVAAKQDAAKQDVAKQAAAKQAAVKTDKADAPPKA